MESEVGKVRAGIILRLNTMIESLACWKRKSGNPRREGGATVFFVASNFVPRPDWVTQEFEEWWKNGTILEQLS